MHWLGLRSYAPNFEEVNRTYWFRAVRPFVHQEPCLLGFWNFIYGFLMENNWHTFLFSCPSYLPFWRYAPLKKSVWNLMYAISYEPCMLAFLNFIYALLMTKNSWPVFYFLSELSPFLELCPFEKIRMKSCQQDISKSIWARGLKLSQLIGDNGKIIWLN